MADLGEQLLKRFVAQGDERAFRQFVERYASMVQQVALRQTGNRQLAEEVSQNVFCAVTKKGAQLLKHPERIPGWLHRAALFESKMAMRKEHSFQKRKQLQHPDDIEETSASGRVAWMLATPHLDPALNRLSESDRLVVLEHYFEGKSFAQIGQQVSRPAGTVQKQCRRAVDKLARILRGKGVTISATVLVSALGTQTGKAASATFVAKISSGALAGGAGYTSTPLTLYMATKSKIVAGAAVAALILPLGVQQAAIHQASTENSRLQESVAKQERKASMRSSSTRNRVVVTRSGEQKLTIEDLRLACEAASREGNLRELEFDNLVATLTAEELAALIPQVFSLSTAQDTKQDLSKKLIGHLTRLDPETAVRVTWKNNAKEVLKGHTGLEEAIYMWAQKDPEKAIVWLKEAAGEVRTLSNSNRDIWVDFDDVVSPLLSSLIQQESPLAREVLSLVPEMYPGHLIREAVDRQYLTGTGQNEGDVQETVAKAMKFLPWLREFAPEIRDDAGMNRRQMIGKLIQDSFSLDHRNEKVIYETFAARPELSAEERGMVVEQRAIEILKRHFNEAKSPGWEALVSDAGDWIDRYSEEDGDAWLQEIQGVVLQSARVQIDYSLKSLEGRDEVSDSQLVDELTKRDFALFPDLRERAIGQAARIQNQGERAIVLQGLGE